LLFGGFCSSARAQSSGLAPITAGIVYGQGGSFTTGTLNNGGVSASSLYNPWGLAFDPNGNLYVADRNNNRVLYYPAGSTTATRVYGQLGSFTSTVADIGGSISANGLDNPYAVAVDSSGNLYVGDGNNNRVLYYPAGSTTATRVYGQNGSFTSGTANNGGISANSLQGPGGLAVDSSGNLYIEATNRILFFPAGSTTATRVYGQGGSFTTQTPNYNGVSATSIGGEGAIALDGSGNLYYADQLNHRVLFYPAGSTTATRVYGQNGSFTSNTANNGGISANSLDQPSAVALDASGNLYVTEYLNNRVLFYPAGSTTATRVYGQGGSFTSQTGNLGGISANSVDQPVGVAVDPSGNLFVSDIFNNRVLEYGPFGNVNVCPNGQSIPAPCSNTYTLSYYAPSTTTFGSTQVVTQGATGLDFQLSGGSTCTSTVTAGNTCLVNVTFAPLAPGMRTGAAELFDSGGNQLAIAPIYGVGQGPAAAFSPGTQTTVPTSGISLTSGVAVDASGNVYISTQGNQVVKVTPGGVQTTVPANGLNYPYDIAVDGAGDVFLADFGNNRVVEVSPSGVQTVVPATGLSSPTGVALDGAGDIFITDNGNKRVVKVTPGGVQTTVPTSGISGAYFPAVDAAGDLFFDDNVNRQVVEVTPGGVQSTVPANGLIAINGVAVDAAGDVFISDQLLNEVVEVTPSGAQTTLPFSGLNVAAGVAVDWSGDVFVADHQNNRVVKLNMSQPPALNFGEVNLGVQSFDMGVTLQNVGNQLLTGSFGTVSGNSFVEDAGNSTCGSFSLAPAASCVEDFYAFPPSLGAINSTALAIDNSLNSNPDGSQQITLNGVSVGPAVSVSVTGAGAGSGSVQSNPTGLNCSLVGGTASGSCSANYPTGLQVSFEEIPTGGSTFTGWSNACASAGTSQFCTITITGPTTVTANFAVAPPPVDTIAVTLLGNGGGTVTDNSTGINCTLSNGQSTGTCNFNYPVGSLLTLTAIPTAGSTFVGWSYPCSGSSLTCTFTVNNTYDVGATFAQQNFGPINVCPQGQTTPAPCSKSLPVTFNIPQTKTLGGIQVLTQGTSGLDFALASAGTCSGTIVGGNSCTANVTFAPLAPGLRMGAATLLDSTGSPIATQMIYGTGQAPLAAFSPSAQVPVNTGSPLNYPNGLLTDAAGNLFIADGDHQRVLKIASNGSVTTVPASALNLPQGMAEDGAGNLFIADNTSAVVEIPAGCTSSACQTSIPNPFSFASELGVAVDGAGNLFVGDFLSGRVAEVPANGGPQTIVYNPGGGSSPVDLTTDSAGNLFIPDYGLQTVVEVPVGCTTNSCVKHIGTGWNRPDDVAVDAAGDVFVADQGLDQIVEVPAGCNNAACQIVLVNGISTVAVKVDAAGDVFFDNLSANPNQVVEITRSLQPALNFALTNVGSTSADSPQVVSIQNIGNQALTGGVALSISPNFVQTGPSCTSFSLVAGAACSQNFSFTPQSPGQFTGTAFYSDNTLNLSSAVALQPVSMVGIGGIGGHATTTTVPNVVGLAQSAASTSLSGSGLLTGSVSTGPSSIVPAGSVIASNPAAGTQVSLNSPVKLLVSTGPGQAPAPNPLSLLNNWFVTGDFGVGGVTLRSAAVVNNMVTGTINIPAGTGPGDVPTGADLIDGILYWTTLESSASPSAGSATFLGYPIAGQQIGSDLPYTDPVTSQAGTLRVYRADVNTWFQNGANGIRVGSGNFTVSLPSTGTNGVLLTEGASLVVIYRVLSPDFPLKAVMIYDGSAIPSTSTTQNILGFYDAAAGNATVAPLYLDSTGWNNPLNSYALASQTSQYSAQLNAGAAYGAVIFSTPVRNPDNDGILGVWKAGPPATDFHGGEPGYYDVKTGLWVGLPGAMAGQKDLFVQLDYMCGAVLTSGPNKGSCDPNYEDLFPSPDTSGNDPLAMVKQAFANSGVALHLQIGNIVPEDTCVDSAGQPCQFPNEPGVVGWKNSLEFSKVWPRNFDACTSGGDCSPRFAYGQKDSYHYVLFGHSLAIPAWNTRYQTLTSINAVVGGTTTIVTADRGASTSVNYCPARITISGIQGMPGLNGIYNTSSCPDSSTIIIPTPKSVVSNWVYPNANLPEPVIGITSGTVTSISGYSDLGGADSAVTLGLWETSPTQDMSKRATVIAGTLFHELGHTIGLSHGGLYYDTTGSYIPTFETNCKPNYQSIMNYLFQLDGIGPASTIAFSNQTLATLNGPNWTVGSLTNTIGGAANIPYSAWYVPWVSGATTASSATLHCDGTPIGTDALYYRVNGPIAPITPGWQNGQEITYTVDDKSSLMLRGFNDLASFDLRQVGATGGQFASLAGLLSFSTSATPLNIAPGGSVSVGPGGTVTLGAGGSITVPAGVVTIPSGGTISGGGTITLGGGGTITLGGGGAVTPGANGIIGLPIGSNATVSAGGTITLGGGGNITLGAGGTVTLGAGGTVTPPSALPIAIPAGGSYTVPAGGTVTLGAGGTVTLGGGGNVTLGAGGTVTLGAGGNVTLGGGGNVTLGAGGTVTLGGGGNVTLGGGGNVTLGGGGTITLGGGGNVTLGGGGNVTLGGGGTVTLGAGGNITLGGGGNVTLGAGGTVTLGAGGNITLGGGGNITLGAGGNITLGAGGTISGGGTITMNAAGNITLGGGGDTINGIIEPAGKYLVGQGGTITLGGGGNVTLGAGGNVTLGAGGNVTLGAGGNITLGGGGTVTLGGGGNVTLGAGGVVTLGGGGTVTLGAGGNVTLGGGGNVTLGGGGATAKELDYDGANSIVRPPPSATYTLGIGIVQVNWTEPAFGVVETYTISRSVNGAPAVVIGSVSGVGGYPPATTFTDTNPATSGTVVYTIATTLAPDPGTGTGTQRQSPPSPPAVLTINQTIALGSLPSSVLISSSTLSVTATAQSNGSPNNQLVNFAAVGPCSAGTSSIDMTSGTSSATVTLNSTGSCTITASQAGDSTTIPVVSPAYNAATPVSGTFMILPANSNLSSQTINFPQVPGVQYGSSPVPVSATASSGLAVTFSTSGPCNNTTTNNMVTITGAGKCAVTASQAGNTTYSAASVTQSFNIAPAVLTVAAGNLAISYGQQIPSLTTDYTTTGYVNGEATANPPVVNGAPSLSTTATSSSAPGNYPITVSTGNLAAANYDFLYMPGTLTIQAGTPTISISNIPANAMYGGSFTPTYSYSGNGTPSESTTSSTPSACTVAPSGLVSFVGVGTCKLTPSATATIDYAQVTGNQQSFSIGKATQTITIVTNAPASAVYGASFAVQATASSGLVVTYGSSGSCTNSGATYTMTAGTGNCTVTYSQAGSANYSAASTLTQTVQANKAVLTVTANNASRLFGAANPTFTAKITGFVNNDPSTVVTGSPSLTTSATTTSFPGTYPIVAAQGTLAAANYTFAFVNGTLTVTYTGSVPPSGTACNGAYSGTFNGNLTVSNGQNCVFVGGGTTGSITETGGNLVLNGATVGSGMTISGGTFTIGPSATIKGNVTIQSMPKSSATNQVCGSTITGNLVFQSNGAAVLIGSSTPSCAGNNVKGNLQIQSNSAATTIDRNTVGGNLQDLSNAGATQVFNNAITSSLQCQSNSSITGGGNTAASKSGQCANF
jgi:sugar lactone lactonase YvrE